MSNHAHTHPKNRAERRAQRAKHDRRAKKRVNGYTHQPAWHKFRHQSTPCSCSMCGNQRRHFGLRTVAEQRQPTTRAELDSIYAPPFSLNVAFEVDYWMILDRYQHEVLRDYAAVHYMGAAPSPQLFAWFAMIADYDDGKYEQPDDDDDEWYDSYYTDEPETYSVWTDHDSWQVAAGYTRNLTYKRRLILLSREPYDVEWETSITGLRYLEDLFGETK